MNDLRPIALTSCVMKVFERCMLFHLNKRVFWERRKRRNKRVFDYIDPYQYAYKSKRGVEDAITKVFIQYLYSFRLAWGNYNVDVFFTSQVLLTLFSLIFHVINF